MRAMALGVALIAIGFSFAFAADPAKQKPNIILFLADDLGYGDLGCYGSTVIDTPNIDRLCQQGMKFTDFYVHQRCSPTRLALMTGSHAHRAGSTKVIYKRDKIGINDSENTIAELLKEGGYATGLIGKWHLGEWDQFNPNRHGFDYFYGFMDDEDRTEAIYHNTQIVERIKSKTDGIHTEKLLNEAINFITANTNKPFFLYYASPLPHNKWLPSEDFKGTSKQGTYGDVVQEIDWQVGELMNTLDQAGLTNNTLIIFASDNGPLLGDGGSAGILREGKWTNFEGGIRTPCLMRWPDRIQPGSTNTQITGIIDFLPTFCEIAGVNIPADPVIDGKSILPYLEGKQLDRPIHDTFIVPGSTIRYGRWKLLVETIRPGGKSGREGLRPAAPAGSLFDLQEDPGETTDLSSQHPEVVADLRQRMDAFMKELQANTREIGKLPDSVDVPEVKKKRRPKE